MLGNDIPAFQEELLTWYRINARTFPWHERKDPFSVLISEKLLQQTAARSTVVLIYEAILSQYPTPEALANADIDSLRELIRPLGFIYRANELPKMAQALVERHQGQVPHSLHELLALPGVGDYGARAVLSFAYGEDLPIVDTNVARWIYRIDGISGPLPSNPARKKSLIRRAAELVPPRQAREWNYAVLDLCALICTPSNPKCPRCPILSFCIYGSSNSGNTS